MVRDVEKVSPELELPALGFQREILLEREIPVPASYGFLGVVRDCLNELRMRLACPGFRDELLARVGPRIGVMVVEQELEAKLPGGSGQLDCVLKIVRQFVGR